MKLLAKRKGLQEEEAKALAESLKEDEEQDILTLAQTADVISKLPKEIQPTLLSLALQSDRKSKFEKIAENVAILSAVLKSINAPDESAASAFAAMMEEMRKEIRELKDEKEKKEKEELIRSLEERFRDYVSALERKISQLTPRTETVDPIDQIKEFVDKVQETKEKMKAIGLLKEEKEELDVEKAEEILRKLGYKVEKPPSWEAMQRAFEEQLKKMREEIRKETIEELKIQEKREALLVDLITTISGAVLDALRTTNTAPLQTNFVEKVKEWKEKKLSPEVQ